MHPAVVSDSDRVRMEEVDRHVASGAGGVAPLIAMLNDKSWVVRRSVVAGLASLGELAVDALCESLLAGRADETRISAAVDALVASTAHVETALGAKMLGHANPAVVVDAVMVMGRRRDPASVPALMALLSHPDDNVAVATTEALGRIGGRAAVDTLIHAVQQGNFFRTFPAIDVLGRSGDPRAVPVLAELLNNPMYAPEAARALGRTGERSAVPRLMSLLQHPSETLVRLGAAAISDLHQRHAERYGDPKSVEQAISEAPHQDAVVRRLVQLLSGSEPSEQAAISLLLGILGGPQAAPALTRLLDSDAESAAAAAQALRRLGREADERTLEMLVRGDSAKRRALLPVIGRATAKDAVLACLTDADPGVRVLACEALGRIANPTATPSLFPMLSDSNPGVVQAAVAAIQALGSRDAEVFALEAARSSTISVRRAGLRILAYFGYGSALSVFLEALTDPDDRIRETALQGLPFLDDRRALDALFSSAKDTSAKTRASAMRGLGFATGDLRVNAFLLRGLEDPDAWVRYYACQALGRLGVDAAADKIAPLLMDEAGQVRVSAVEALSHLKSERAALELQKAATSSEDDVRRAALIGLGMSRSSGALHILIAAAASEDAATRMVAISSMADFDSPEVLPALGRAARDIDASVGTAAIGFLGSYKGEEAAHVLVSLLADHARRPEVGSALSVWADGRIDGLLAALVTADHEIAAELTAALARMRRRDATAALFRALELPNVAARKAAAGTLAAIGTPQAFAALRKQSTQDGDPEVRRICALLLAQ